MIATLIEDLKERGIRLCVNDGKLNCSAPTGALTPELTTRIKEAKAELIEMLMGAEQSITLADSMEHIQNQENYPLSSTQQRTSMIGHPGAFLPIVLELTGPLDAALLNKTLNHFIERHAPLRSRFKLNGNDPHQIVSEYQPFEIKVGKLDTDTTDALNEAVERLSKNKADLSQGISFHLELLVVSETKHILFAAFSPFVFDGWSFDLFWSELTQGYAALAEGKGWPFTPLEFTYADCTAWFTSRIQQREDDLINFWRSHLGETLPLDVFPLAGRPSADQGTSSLPFSLDSKSTEIVRTLVAKEALTPQAILLAGIYIWSSQLRGVVDPVPEDPSALDVVVGIAVEGRPHAALEKVVGPFANLILLRESISREESFISFVKRVQKDLLNAHQHQELPVQLHQIRSRAGSTRTFQIEFSFQQTTGRSEEMGPLRMRQIESRSGTSAVDVMFWVKDWGDRFAGAIEFRSDSFNKQAVEQWVACYYELLTSMLNAPDKPISQHSLLPQTELDRIEKMASADASVVIDERQQILPFEVPGRVSGKEGLFILSPEFELKAHTPQYAEPKTEGDYQPPISEAEIVQAEIWQQLLGLERVGLNDDFFELGGQSLLATRLLQKVLKDLGVRLPIRTIFDRPTLADFTEAVVEKGDASATQKPIVKPTQIIADSGNPLATAAQMRFWYLGKLSGDAAAYNIVVCLNLEGTLDCDRLQYALNELVARHEILRTNFVLLDGQLEQEIRAPFSPEIAKIEVDALSIQGAPKEFEEDVSKAIDVNAFPLFRVTLASANKDHHALLLTFHHCISDGWTLGRLTVELTNLYEGKPVSESPRQYRDYTDIIGAEDEAAQITFWQKQLSGNISSLALPTDRPTPSTPSTNGTTHICTLPSIEKIHKAARGVNVTPYVFMLGVFHVLCSRWSGVNDFCIGAPFSLREEDDPAAEALGPWLNTITLRIPPADLSTPLDTFLGTVKNTCLDAYENRSIPFEKVLQNLRSEHESVNTSLFQVLFALDDTHTMASFQMGALECTHMRVPTYSSRLDLSVWMSTTADAIEACFEYNTDLIESATIERFAAAYNSLVEAAISAPKTPLSALPLIDDTQFADLTLGRNQNWQTSSEKISVHAAFERQVDLTPDAIAVQCDGESLSYQELDQRANHLAHALRDKGADRGQIVGLSIPRSNDILIGLLAILKTGAAYLPLDPEYPQERLSYMLEDSGTKILIGTSDQSSLAEGLEFLALDDFDFERTEHTRFTEINPVEDLAYVIYTSGSTGKPKGVMVEHRNAHNFFLAMDDVLELQPGETGTIIAVTSMSFDISVLELFWSLSRGFKVIVQSDNAEAANSAAALIVEHKATHFQCTPSQARMVLADPQVDEALSGLKKMLLGGEALPVDVASQLVSKVGGQVINVYGPTETTIWSAYHPLRQEDSNTIPIGGPIINTALYILDEQFNPVPAGVIGELYIGGEGVVRGYLGNQALTESRFLDDPFRESGNRMYRTGDTVRYREDGTMQFCGRTDHQVKLRGHRIEMGEVEAHLTKLASIKEAACVVREDQPGDQRLVAYVRVDDAFDEVSVRDELAEIIPDYMLPNTFISLDKLPLTPNGKIDRKSLPAPSESLDQVENDQYVAPRTDIELRLSLIWQNLLGISRVGSNDDFFKLGGHSLLVLQLAKRIETEFDTTIELAHMFAQPVLTKMAAVLSGSAEISDRALVAIKQEGEGSPIFCMCGINLYRELAESLGDEQPFLAMYVPEEEALFTHSDEGSGPEQGNAVQDLARAYYEMIRKENGDQPLRLIGFCFGGAIAYEVALLAEADGIEVTQVILLESVIWDRLKRRNVRRVKNLVTRIFDQGPSAIKEAITRDRHVSTVVDPDTIDAGDRLNMLGMLMGGYTPQGQLKSETVLVFTDDPSMYATWKVTPLFGWEGHLLGKTHVIKVQGSHTGLLKRPLVKEIAEQIQPLLLDAGD